MDFKLIKTTTSDNWILNGLFSAKNKNNPVIISIHGTEGDFFSNEFISVIAAQLAQDGSSLLSIQTRGSGCVNYLRNINPKDNKIEKFGSHFEKIKDCVLDIDAWIQKLLELGYKDIVLMGHSLGAIKMMYYYFLGDKKNISKLIALAPYNIHSAVTEYTQNKIQEYIQQSEVALTYNRDLEYVPKEYYLFQQSYQTFHSFFNEANYPLTSFWRYDHSPHTLMSQVTIPVKIVVGNQDPWFYYKTENGYNKGFSFLKSNLIDVELSLIEGGNHQFMQKEENVAAEVLSFIQKNVV